RAGSLQRRPRTSAAVRPRAALCRNDFLRATCEARLRQKQVRQCQEKRDTVPGGIGRDLLVSRRTNAVEVTAVAGDSEELGDLAEDSEPAVAQTASDRRAGPVRFPFASLVARRPHRPSMDPK